MRNILNTFFSPWVILGAFGIAICLLTSSILFFLSTRSSASQPGSPTAQITKIPAPTATIPGITSQPQDTATPSPDSLPGNKSIGIGSYVQIIGTEGAGLNIRSAPTLQSSINYVGLDSEVFIVKDGPKDADGFSWYLLAGFYDENLGGWAASNFLEIIQPP